MNTRVVYKAGVNDAVLDCLAKELPEIIAKVMEVPGGNLAILKPGQIALEFAEANSRDTGSDIRIMVFARSNDPRAANENDLAKSILEKVVLLTGDAKHSVDVRVYLLDVGAAAHC